MSRCVKRLCGESGGPFHLYDNICEYCFEDEESNVSGHCENSCGMAPCGVSLG